MTTYPLDDFDYSAADAELFNCPRSSGIYATEDFPCTVTGDDNVVTIGVGVAWIRNARLRGKVAALPNEMQLDMGVPDAAYPRIDAIVIQFDANSNGTKIVQKKGTPASNPVPPELVQTEALYELHRYHVRREAGAVSITAADITDLALDSTYCGLMADAITKIDMEAINAQATALIKQLRVEISAVKDGSAYVMKSGDSMTGPLVVLAPSEAGHAASKGYVDGKRFFGALTLAAADWAGAAAPYTQTVALEGILATDRPHYGAAYSADQQTRLAQKEAFSLVDELDTADGAVTFTCFEDRPGTDIPIQMEVNR